MTLEYNHRDNTPTDLQTAPAETQVSETILAKLGGCRFIAMTGARCFVGDAGGLHFKLPGTPGFVSHGINLVKINLNRDDLYDIQFIRFRASNLSWEPIATREGIYADMLREVFESETGLRTSL